MSALIVPGAIGPSCQPRAAAPASCRSIRIWKAEQVIADGALGKRVFAGKMSKAIHKAIQMRTDSSSPP